MIRHIALAVLITGTSLFAQPDSKERLAQFIQSPPPIREMAVECTWYAHADGKTNTNWIVLCWQTNAYILRSARQQVGLFDAFDTNRDDLITIRAGDTYSTVSYYKVWGVHIMQVQKTGPVRVTSSGKIRASAWDRDRVLPIIRGQEELAANALTLGIPVPVGRIAITDGTFSYRDEADGTTLAGAMEVGGGNAVKGFSLTNVVDLKAERERVVVPMTVRYEYDNSLQPSWFPHEIVRDAVIRGKELTICRLVIHRLSFGAVRLAEFNPERFLKK